MLIMKHTQMFMQEMIKNISCQVSCYPEMKYFFIFLSEHFLKFYALSVPLLCQVRTTTATSSHYYGWCYIVIFTYVDFTL